MCNSMANSLDTNPIQSTWELAWIELLSYHAHLKKSAAKVSTRNLLRLLVGSSWGASATTLRTSALAHCYSTAEYCAPVWARSPYTKLDVQLNESMHSVSGTLHSTPLPWLPVFSHITPPHIRRMAATNQLLSKIRSSAVTLPLISDIESHPEVHLSSRRPVWLQELKQKKVSPRQKWTEE